MALIETKKNLLFLPGIEANRVRRSIKNFDMFPRRSVCTERSKFCYYKCLLGHVTKSWFQIWHMLTIWVPVENVSTGRCTSAGYYTHTNANNSSCFNKKKKKIPGNNVNQNKASDITEKVSNELSFSAEASGLRLHRTCIILQ